jgi:hypothetical protein
MQSHVGDVAELSKVRLPSSRDIVRRRVLIPTRCGVKDGTEIATDRDKFKMITPRLGASALTVLQLSDFL